MLEDDGSVTCWIRDLHGENASEASRQLWNRYFTRLARLARAMLQASAHGPADEEDVALSAFESFFRGTVERRFPELADRDDLWKLLVTITARKAANQRRSELRQKRGGGRVVTEAALTTDRDADPFLAQIVGDEPTPEFALLVTEEYRRLFGSLSDESLRVVALLKLEGYTNDEIADSLDCGLRTVERKLEVIRKRWSSETAPD